MTVRYPSKGAEHVTALNAVHLSVNASEIVGVMGESGSGKSTLAAALLRLLPAQAEYQAGAVLLDGSDVLKMPEAELRRLRGARAALIPQDPATALNPVLKVGTQVAEVLRAHLSLSRSDRKKRVLELLREVGFDAPERTYSSYPHELSGGQRQRIAIAQAMACGPALLIADEPTSKLDSVLQVEILRVMSEVVRRHNTALILITHDPAILAAFADRIVVMYAGQVVEEGTAAEVLRNPLHPYTRALLQLFATGQEKSPARGTEFPIIAGDPPDLTRTEPGCRFEARCPERMDICSRENPRESVQQSSHRVSCFKYE